MAKILVVDVEKSFRDGLENHLVRRGHCVLQAQSAQEAIDLGARYRPEVLVSNRVLRSALQGLHVTRALNLVDSSMRTILLTDYLDRDLQEDAQSLGIYRILAKPTPMVELESIVSEAAHTPPTSRRPDPIAVLEVEPAGKIVHGNRAARKLLASTVEPGSKSPISLIEAFAEGELPDLDLAADRWIPATPKGTPRQRWFLRSRQPRPDQTRILAISEGSEPALESFLDALSGLLRLPPQLPLGWPYPGRVLVLDQNPFHRRLLTGILEVEGVGCYAVDRAEGIERILGEDQEIGLYILDFESAGLDLHHVLESIERTTPNATIIGTSAGDHSQQFSRLGVSRFVGTPWRIPDFLDLIRGEKAEN